MPVDELIKDLLSTRGITAEHNTLGFPPTDSAMSACWNSKLMSVLAGPSIVGGPRAILPRQKNGPGEKTALEDQEFGCDMLCPIYEPEWKSWLKKGPAMKRKNKLTIAIATAVLAVVGAVALYAQDKYSLKSP